jgi:hypothetical protein
MLPLMSMELQYIKERVDFRHVTAMLPNQKKPFLVSGWRLVGGEAGVGGYVQSAAGFGRRILIK